MTNVTVTESPTKKEISCRVTRTLLMYVRESNNGSLGALLDGLELDEAYLLDPENWVSHAFLQRLYHRMIDILGDENAVYKMAAASGRFQSLGLLERIGRLLGNPKLLYSQAPRYNKLLKLNGDVHIRDIGDSWVLLEDRYHDNIQKTRYDCDYTRGIITMMPTLFGMPPADVQEVECQVLPETYGNRFWTDAPKQGCRGCLYRVEWQAKSRPPFWKRFFLRHQIYRRTVEDLLAANRKIQEKYEEVKRLAADLETANKQLIESKTELESKQAELLLSERRYRMIAENVTDIIWTLRLDTFMFDYVSPSVEKIRGFTQTEALTQDLSTTLSPRSHQIVTKIMQDELARDGNENVDPDRSRTLEVEHLYKDGTYHWAESTVSFIRDQEGRPVGVLGVSRDISERKRIAKEAEEFAAQRQRAQKMEALGNLAAGVAHDLNNILSGIVSYPDLLLFELPEDSPLRQNVINIQKSGQKAAAIVQDLLTLARRGINETLIVNINEIISDYLNSPEHIALAGRHPNVRFEIDQSDDLMNIKGSPVHLSKVIMNLVSNAAEAMPAGGKVRITTENVYLDTPKNGFERIPEGEYVLFNVLDEGIGIPESDLKHIFDPFYSKKRMKKSGSGLGTTIIWASVKDHNGFVDLYSFEGEGTRFDVYLPATREELHIESRRPVVEDFLGNERILVVDDVEDQREIAEKLLSKLGYDVVSVSSGEKAVEHLRTRPVDLLVLDMIMPGGMDGLETYRRIIADHPGQKAIVTSGYSESDRVKDLLQLGAGAYVRKPYTLESIGSAVRMELDRET